MAAFYSLHCNALKLAKKDGFFGKSDPYIVIRRADKLAIGFSEVIKDNLNPTWKPIELDVQAAGGMNAFVTFTVYDYDDDGGDDLIGSFQTTVGALVQGKKEYLLQDPKGKKGGRFVMSQAVPQQKARPQAYDVVFMATGLPKLDGMFNKSDPFLEIFAKGKGPGTSTSHHLISKTKVVMNDQSPTWESIQLTEKMCGGHDATLLIRAFDYDSNGKHDYMGEASTSLRQIVSAGPWLTLFNKGKKGSRGYVNSGVVKVARATPTAATLDSIPANYKIAIKGVKLKDMDFIGKSDPYLVIKTGNTIVHTTETIQNNSNPVWKPFTISVAQVGIDTPLILNVFDSDDMTSDDLIGTATSSLRELSLFAKNPSFKICAKNGKKTGLLTVTSVTASGAAKQRNVAVAGGHPQQSGYGAPQAGYGAPQAGYGAPPQGAGGYGAPQVGYGAPQQSGYGAPPQQGGYGAPQGGYAPQQSAYGAPPQQGGYGAPQSGYAPQQSGYAPQQAPGGYGAAPARDAAPGGYGAVQSGYGATQQSGYGAPQQSGYAPQQSGYAPPQQSGYAPQQSGYAPGPTQGGYAPQQSGYAPPQAGGYAPQQAPGGYGAAPPAQSGYAPQGQGGYPGQSGYAPQGQGGY